MIATATLDMKPTPPTQRVLPTAAPVSFDRLVLTGFMGSGKSTIGPLLAAQLGWNFVDLDTEIERRDGRSVPQIFAESGEAHFRRLESAALASLLGSRHAVLALGGGAAEELGNRLLLEQTPRTAIVYLAAPLDTLLDRCRRQAATPGAIERPLLANLEAAARRFDVRRRLYERIASHTVETSALGAEETSWAVLKALRPLS